MSELPPKQHLALEALLASPDGLKLDQLAEALSVTRTAAMGHLQKLMDMGYVSFSDSQGSVGRPKRSYLISEAGLEVFPRKYSWLSNIMLEELASQLGSKGVGAFMRKLGEKVATSMAERVQGETVLARLKQVAKILNELGYQAGLKAETDSKSHVIEAVNCVYHAVAKEHPELCQFDVKFIEKASGMDVRLESCIARGGKTCRFCVTEKESKRQATLTPKFQFES